LLISELAKAAGLSKDGIRHYEEVGLISSSARRAGSRVYRDYDPSALKTIENVRQAQRLGLSLKEIRDLLAIHGSRYFSREETIHFLRARLAIVQEQQSALREVERFIRDKLKRYEAGNNCD
jgi:DNA-binding transcriptional MerR regulator